MSIEAFVKWEVDSRYWNAMIKYIQAVTPVLPSIIPPFLLPFMITFSEGLKTGRLTFEFLFKFPFLSQYTINLFNMIVVVMVSYFPILISEIESSDPILVPLGRGRPPNQLRNFKRFGSWTKSYLIQTPTWRLNS